MNANLLMTLVYYKGPIVLSCLHYKLVYQRLFYEKRIKTIRFCRSALHVQLRW